MLLNVVAKWLLALMSLKVCLSDLLARKSLLRMNDIRICEGKVFIIVLPT